MKITACIITFNEERNIGRCLDSLSGIADEIIVVDSFSSDKTETICKKKNVRFIQQEFLGYVQQKNFALKLATNDWVISLDADEAISENLKKSILTLKNTQNKELLYGYSFNRLTNYCGHWIKHCGWYPDTKLRFVNRHKALWVGKNIHEKLMILDNSPIGFLNGDLLHYSYYTRDDHFRQIEHFGNIAAQEFVESGKKINWFIIISKVIFQFIKSYFIKSGVRDGKIGFTISRLSAYATYRKYLKVLQLQRQK